MPFARRSALLAKRTLDVALAFAGLVLLSPLMVGIGVAVVLESSGSVLYVSRRLGRNGRVFHCVKFRTMRPDGRVTRLGSVLRRYGLDEIPQLANVLRGEMSVVGPRPLLASDSSQAAGRFRRFDIKPGMTGLWAMPQPENLPIRSYISPGESYRSHWTLWLDLLIVMRTLRTALAGNGH